MSNVIILEQVCQWYANGFFFIWSLDLCLDVCLVSSSWLFRVALTFITDSETNDSEWTRRAIINFPCMIDNHGLYGHYFGDICTRLTWRRGQLDRSTKPFFIWQTIELHILVTKWAFPLNQSWHVMSEILSCLKETSLLLQWTNSEIAWLVYV